jgi:hypothetical protein
MLNRCQTLWYNFNLRPCIEALSDGALAAAHLATHLNMVRRCRLTLSDPR